MKNKSAKVHEWYTKSPYDFRRDLLEWYLAVPRVMVGLVVVLLVGSLGLGIKREPQTSWYVTIFDNLESIALGSAGLLFVLEAVNRQTSEHYQAWQVVNSAMGQTGSGGRIQALQDLNRDGVSLEGVAAPRADLTEIDLHGANLRRANFQRANLKRANLQGADLSYANLKGVNLSEANLVGANLWQANLQNAHVDSGQLQEAELGAANLQGVSCVEANFEGAHLQTANLRDAFLYGANLQRTNLTGTSLENADLTKADLKHAYMYVTHLRKTDLTETNIQEAIVVETDLNEAKGLDIKQKNKVLESNSSVQNYLEYLKDHPE